MVAKPGPDTARTPGASHCSRNSPAYFPEGYCIRRDSRHMGYASNAGTCHYRAIGAGNTFRHTKPAMRRVPPRGVAKPRPNLTPFRRHGQPEVCTEAAQTRISCGLHRAQPALHATCAGPASTLPASRQTSRSGRSPARSSSAPPQTSWAPSCGCRRCTGRSDCPYSPCRA